MNPLTGTQYSDEWHVLMKRDINKLPIMKPAVVKEFLKLLDNNNVIIVESSTGSGKSVRAPILAFEHYNYKVNIILSQPTTATIPGIAGYLSKQLDTEVGGVVGWIYGKGRKTSNATKIYVIIDTIFNRVEDLLFGYNVESASSTPAIFFLDETHSRTIPMDIIMATYFKAYNDADIETLALPSFPKLVLLSATIDVNFYKDYFRKSGAKVDSITVGGKVMPLDHIWINPSHEKVDYKQMPKIVLTILKDIVTNPKMIGKKYGLSSSPDILIFYPTKLEGIKGMREMMSYVKKNEIHGIYIGVLSSSTEIIDRQWIVLPPHSDTSYGYRDTGAYKLHYKRDDPFEREKDGKFVQKIIFSTDIARTGLTIKGIEIVIDSGFINNVYFDSHTRKKFQEIVYSDKASVTQRCGRAGRTSPGICIHPYNKVIYDDEFGSEIIPHILTHDYVSLLKSLLVLFKGSMGGVNEVLEIIKNMPTPPNIRLFKDTIGDFYEWGIIEDGKLSRKGEVASDLGMNIRLGLLVIESAKYNASKYIVPIVTFMHSSRGGISSWGPDKRKYKSEYYAFVKKFSSPYGIPFSYLKLWNEFNTEFIGKYLRGHRRIVASKDPSKRGWYLRRLRKWCTSKKYKYMQFKDFMTALLKLEYRLHKHKNYILTFGKYEDIDKVDIADKIKHVFMNVFSDSRIMKINNKWMVYIKALDRLGGYVGKSVNNDFITGMSQNKLLGYTEILWRSQGDPIISNLYVIT